MKKSIEHGWDNADKGKLMYLEKNLSPYHFIHHKTLTASNLGICGEGPATN
jgi:hypothetical protein